MNVEIRAEAALFPEKEYISRLFGYSAVVLFGSPSYKTQRFRLISNPFKNLQTHAKKVISEKVTESTNMITINFLNAVYLL